MSNNDQLEKIHVDDGTGKPFDLLKVDNVLFPAYFCEDPTKRLEEVRNVPGRDDDVIIVAYPKAGTHWLWEVTNMLLRGSAEYHPAVKELQMLEMTGAKGTEDLPSPRVFNTHLRFRHLPKDMINRNCKLIYVTRNPKDMAVSRYCHNKRGDLQYKGTFSDYLRLYLDGKIAFGSWIDYTLDWSSAIQDNKEYPIHHVVYEELKRNSFDEVKKLADFLGVNADDSLIKGVCEQCSFTKLRSSYAQSKQTVDGKEAPINYAFRKGEIGDWKNWFTVAENDKFDEMIEDKLPPEERTFIYQ